LLLTEEFNLLLLRQISLQRMVRG